jgi:hypothetical protein
LDRLDYACPGPKIILFVKKKKKICPPEVGVVKILKKKDTW